MELSISIMYTEFENIIDVYLVNTNYNWYTTTHKLLNHQMALFEKIEEEEKLIA